jgi:hypothetical protein
MKTALIVILVLVSNYSFSQSKLGSKDPCYADTNSPECRDKIVKAVFFMNHADGSISAKDASYVEAYFEKYGIEGFYIPASQWHAGSLLVSTLNQSTNTEFNNKLLMAFPKEGKVDEKNIFDIVIKKNPPFRRESILKAYISNLNTLFPVEGNEDFQKTKDKFGLPWEDPNFVQGYLDRIQSMVREIDESNEFFKRNEFQDEKKDFIAIMDRLKKLQQIPTKACAVNQYEEFVELKNKYGNILNSPTEDIVSCMIKSGKYDIVQKVIDNSGCDKERLPSYFDQAVAIKETPETFKFSQFLYLKMSQCEVKINPVKGEANRDFLQRGSAYLNKYHQDEILCDTQNLNGTTLVDLSKTLDQTLYIQAYQLMEKTLAEKDSVKKAELVEQLIALKNVGVKLAVINPTTGKTLLHLMAEAGDYELLNELSSKGLHPTMLGHKVLDKNGKTPLKVAIEGGKLNNLKFVQVMFKGTMNYNKEELRAIKKDLRNIKAENKEAKTLKKMLVESVKKVMID